MEADAGATSDRGRHGSVLGSLTTDGHEASPDHRRGPANVESDFEIHASLIASKDGTLVQEEAEWLLKVLRGHFLFSSMPVNQLLSIVKKMERVGCKAGQELIKEGQADAKHFYVVASGALEVTAMKNIEVREKTRVDANGSSPSQEGESRPVVVARLGASACLGEMALLYNSTRTASVRASEESQVFRLARGDYQAALKDENVGSGQGKAQGAEEATRLPILRKFPWLHDQIRPMHRGRVVASMTKPVAFAPGDPVLQSGKVGGVLMMIVKGELQFTGDPQKATRDSGVWRSSSVGELCGNATMREGDALAIGRPGDEALLATLHESFIDGLGISAGSGSQASGQLRLLGGTHHHCTAVAVTAVEAILIAMPELQTFVADSPTILSNQAGIRALLQNTPWCHDVSRQELDALAFAFMPLESLEGDVVIEEGSPAAALHVVVAGELKVTTKKPDGREVLIFKPGPGDVLGERSIASGVPSMANVSVEVPSVTLCLTRDAYASSLPSRIQPRIEKKRYASQISSAGFESLDELNVIAVVGQGAFARVALATHKPTGIVYALKKITREKVREDHVRKQIMNERFVMGDVDHQFIAKLHATFKTSHSLFMVVEPCLGGELFSLMQRLDVLPESNARFYASCVAKALEHLHARHVIYRDLKPENVMIHSSGYVKIIDFGFAKRLNLRAYTLCGTPEYLSPEMVMVRGHGKGVDWWALGILLYEMVMAAAPHIIDPFTKRPIYDLPPPELYRAILNKNFAFHFPSHLSAELCDAVRGLLAFDSINRLGCMTDGAQDVYRHPFFAAEDWDALMAQTRTPPFLPQLKDQTDVSNFDEPLSDDSFVNEPPYDYSRSDWDRDF